VRPSIRKFDSSGGKWYPAVVKWEEVLALAGRLFLAAIFLAAAFGKITNFDATTKYMEAHALPWPALLCGAAAFVETLGGISLALGACTRWGAAALAAFVLAATLVFHTAADQRIHLLKNFAILGGLLLAIASGPGALSLDGRSGR